MRILVENALITLWNKPGAIKQMDPRPAESAGCRRRRSSATAVHPLRSPVGTRHGCLDARATFPCLL